MLSASGRTPDCRLGERTAFIVLNGDGGYRSAEAWHRVQFRPWLPYFNLWRVSIPTFSSRHRSSRMNFNPDIYPRFGQCATNGFLENSLMYVRAKRQVFGMFLPVLGTVEKPGQNSTSRVRMRAKILSLLWMDVSIASGTTLNA